MAWRRWAAHWPLIPALAVGAWLRLGGLAAGSSPYYGDAAEYALVARSLAQDPLDLSYPDVEQLGPTPFVSQPPLVLYLFALAIRLTGSPEMGPLAVSALLGTATIGLLYAIATLVRGRWTGAAAAVFLAVLPFHVRASREAQLDAALAFLLTATVLALLLWQRRPTLLRAGVAGSLAAAAAMAKLPGVLAAALVAAALLAIAIARRRGAPRAPRISAHIACALAPAALLLGAYTAILWHLEATTDLAAKLSWQAGRVAGEGTLVRPWHWYFTELDVGLVAQLGPLVLALAATGVVLAVRDLLQGAVPRREAALLLFWPAILLAALVATARKEWFYAVILNPPLALLAAWPVGLLARAASARHLAATSPSGPDPGTAPAPAKPTPVRSFTPAPVHSAAPVSRRPWVAGVASLLAVSALWAPAGTTAEGPGGFGTGVREAAEWIHAEDPEAVQVGTTLGRFTLHFANGQPTYHFWMNHTYVEEGVRRGEVRYVVIDSYAPAEGELEWLEDLVRRHGGTLASEHRSEGQVTVRLYRLHATSPGEPA